MLLIYLSIIEIERIDLDFGKPEHISQINDGLISVNTRLNRPSACCDMWHLKPWYNGYEIVLGGVSVELWNVITPFAAVV